MKFFSTLAALAALTISAQAFTSCGKATDDLQLTSVSYTPNPPRVGQNICVTLKGTLKKEVTQGAMIRVEGKFWGMPVYDQTANLCDSLAGGANPCPIPTTTTELTQCFPIPANVPANMEINLKVTSTNNGGSALFCIQGPITFKP
ncbi:Phosphatidylglycerol/phosphatidylinositol transfer protein [Actinomortierella ambigua]|uniref:Phosphatidylglycerol/phosphatidylinositol transfer protein n=1 Tax=Actinomortierella ambigua TaxID=1343610 RepID=A0A9P6QLD0_9FUNG|nr:Phosphatidylglycerol/phosphatidylinositol transfer protein [Actinomortierella ambigua]